MVRHSFPASGKIAAKLFLHRLNRPHRWQSCIGPKVMFQYAGER
jgi:hypothetical protein